MLTKKPLLYVETYTLFGVVEEAIRVLKIVFASMPLPDCDQVSPELVVR